MKVGDRVRANCYGAASGFAMDRNMRKGEEGIITQLCDGRAQVQAKDGTLFCRTTNYLDVIKSNPEGYEIY